MQHRGQPFACLLRDPNFWRAVAVGAVGGTVSGFVAGFFAPLMLLSSGVGTAMQIGGFIGMLASFSSHVVTNVLYGRPATEGVGWAMLSGAVFGALGGALGYTISNNRGQFVGYHGTSSKHLPSLQKGIDPGRYSGANFRGRSQLGPGFYVTRDRQAAEYFAQMAVIKRGGDPWRKDIEGQIVGDFAVPIDFRPVFKSVLRRDPTLRKHLQTIEESSERTKYHIT